MSVRAKVNPVTRLGWYPVDEYRVTQMVQIKHECGMCRCFQHPDKAVKNKMLALLILVNHLHSPHFLRETTANPPVLISAVILHSCAHSPHFSLHSVPLSFITSPYVDSSTLLFPGLILLTQRQPNEVRYTVGLIGGDGQSLLAKTINKMDHTLSHGGFQIVVCWETEGIFKA